MKNIDPLKENLLKLYQNDYEKTEECKSCYLHGTVDRNTHWNLGVSWTISNPKLAFIGKNTWGPTEDAGKLLELYKRINDYYDSETGDTTVNSRYWRAVKTISEKVHQLQPSKEFLKYIFVSNLAKCGADSEHPNIVTSKKAFRSCKNIFQKEIELVKPTHLIILTGTSYDDIIEGLNFTTSEPEDKTSQDDTFELHKSSGETQRVPWWHRKYSTDGRIAMHLLRTRHPQGAFREFEQEIALWVNRNKVVV